MITPDKTSITAINDYIISIQLPELPKHCLPVIWFRWAVNIILRGIGIEDWDQQEVKQAQEQVLKVINVARETLFTKYPLGVFLYKEEVFASIIRQKNSQDTEIQKKIEELAQSVLDFSPQSTFFKTIGILEKPEEKEIAQKLIVKLGPEIKNFFKEIKTNPDALPFLERLAEHQIQCRLDKINNYKITENTDFRRKEIIKSEITLGLPFEKKAEENVYFQLGLYTMENEPNKENSAARNKAAAFFRKAITETWFIDLKAFDNPQISFFKTEANELIAAMNTRKKQVLQAVNSEQRPNLNSLLGPQNLQE